MKNILIPTDFSDCANEAAKVAIKLAAQSGATLRFIHLMETPFNWLSQGVDLEKRYPDVSKKVRLARNELNKLLDQAEKSSVLAKVDIEYNQDYSMIIKYIEMHAIDLVVMGSHGVKGIKELFIGSNTQKIVRLSPVPVLVIKHAQQSSELKRIVFVYDFEETAHQHFLTLADFAALVGAEVDLLFINTPLNFKESKEIELKLEEYAQLKPSQIGNKRVYNSFSFEKGLLAYCAENSVDMVAMLTHGRKGINRLMNSSITERVINHINIPVWSFNIQSAHS
ncbi:nucleotide-binding universal stress UspA family protein [Catalinimonas alkaloidigena]|uniref:universal stress protein n=1 Tax=Catalinimonas alkaloidigena TaxID=1075417 RepID=UPI002405BAB1|nr:universal stress protein [Catalinimonas alkaloidigena]MDF9796541.1 nucleotide-binding universal stress UspA family protein [Catalinimonas alkaloidigena]